MSRVLKDEMSINDVDEKEWEEMTDEEREKVAEKEEKEQKLQSMITKGTKIVAPIFLFIALYVIVNSNFEEKLIPPSSKPIDFTCNPGEGINVVNLIREGNCKNTIYNEKDCKEMADRIGIKSDSFRVQDEDLLYPPGCFYYEHRKELILNINYLSDSKCIGFWGINCICADGCAPCPAGQYGPGGNHSLCFNCPPGTFNTVAKQENKSSCKNCNIAGTYSNGTNCNTCEKGHYCPVETL